MKDAPSWAARGHDRKGHLMDGNKAGMPARGGTVLSLSALQVFCFVLFFGFNFLFSFEELVRDGADRKRRGLQAPQI